MTDSNDWSPLSLSSNEPCQIASAPLSPEFAWRPCACLESADETDDRAARVGHCRVRRVLGRVERPTDRADLTDGAGRRRPMGATGPIDRSELRIGVCRIERQALPPRRLSGEPA